MAREIKTTLAVDGEQAYKRAIKEASNSISQMGSQLTLATAQFKADGDAMKLMETRSKTLKAEIGQQKEIVKSLEGALKEITERYGEDSKEAEKWQAQLNRAQTKLINLQTELENNDKGLDKNGKSFAEAAKKSEAFAQSVKSTEKETRGIKFLELHTAIDSVTSKLTSAIRTAVSVGKQINNIVTDSGKWADDLGTMSLRTGLSVETLQEWSYAAEYAETDIETIVKAMDKLANPTADASKAMKELGIHTKEAYAVLDENGAVDTEIVSKDRVTILWETIDAMRAMVETMGEEEAAVQLEATANELFGKSFRDILPLIKQGKDGWAALTKEAEENGLVMSGDGVKALNDYYDSTQRLEQQMEALKHTVSAELAPGMQQATDAFTELLRNVNEWAQSDEGKKALTKLSDAIGTVFSALVNQDFSGIVETATGAITGLTGALGWFDEHSETVLSTLRGIAISAIVIKGLDLALSFGALFNPANWGAIKQGSDAMGSAFGKSPAGGWLTLLRLLIGFAPYAAGLAVLLTPTPTADDQWDSLYDKYGNVTEAGKANGLPDTIAEYDSWTDAQKEAHDTTSRIAAEQEKMEAAIVKYLAFLNGSDYSRYSDSELRDYLLKGIPWFGVEPVAQKSQEEFLWILDDLKSRFENGEALSPNMDAAKILEEYSAGTTSEDAFKRTAQNRTRDDVYRELEDLLYYDPELQSISALDYWKKLLEPRVEEYASLQGVAEDGMQTIREIALDAFANSLEDDWEGSPVGILNIIQEAIDELDTEAAPDAEAVGEAVSQGVADGIDAGIPAAVDATGRLAAAINAKLRADLQIASPSKVTRGLGQFVGEGFALGIDDAQGRVLAAVNRMTAINTPRRAAGGIVGGTYNGQTYNNSRSIYIDKYNQYSGQDVNGLMDLMDAETRYDNQGMGA